MSVPTRGLVFSFTRLRLYKTRGRYRGRAAGVGSQVSLVLTQAPLLPQVLRTNQFSVTRHEKVASGLMGDQGLPGVFVLYELSPMMVKLTEKHR